MNLSTNLVPAACLERHVRRTRRNVWLGVGVTGGFVVLVLWAWGAYEAAAADRFRRQLDDARARLGSTERALTSDLAKRGELLAALDHLSTLRHPQLWSRRLATLTRNAPLQVVLTELKMEAGHDRSATATPSALGRRNRGSSGKDVQVEEQARSRHTVFVKGLALDHEALIRLIRAIEDIEDFDEVEMVRATREPYRSAFAIAFELKCRVKDPLQ